MKNSIDFSVSRPTTKILFSADVRFSFKMHQIEFWLVLKALPRPLICEGKRKGRREWNGRKEERRGEKRREWRRGRGRMIPGP